MHHRFPSTFIAAASRLLTVVGLFLAVFAGTSHATPEQDDLFKALKTAPNQAEATLIENEIWKSWMAAGPTLDIRSKVKTAMELRDNYDLAGAKVLLDDVIVEAPDYSEGWNQRAFILFLQGDYEASLADIDRALELEPRHFGALSGKGMILMTLGRTDFGQKVLREAVDIHPFLKERNMLLPENRPAKGVDL
ncbi:MAG: tetratricopeptide repeat protein [Roseibium sp.]